MLVAPIVLAAALAAALPSPDPDNGAIKLPPGFRALVVADDLGRLRFMTVSPSGDLYVKTRREGIIALRDTDGDGRADVKETFGGGGGTGIAFREGWLYHSTDEAVLRYRLTPGELIPKGEPETIVSGLPAGQQHSAKSFAFDDWGRLYVEVGSPANAYGEPDRAKGSKGRDATEFLTKHGGFWRFDPLRTGQMQTDGFHFSTGHRHILSLAWNPISRAFFVVMMGRDNLNTVDPDHYTDDDNAEIPAEEMHRLREGMNFGWPYTYWDPLKKARMAAPEFGGDNAKRADAGHYAEPILAFPAHWAPLQMSFYQGAQFPAKYRGGAFLVFHGSWNRAPRPQKGYNVVFIPFDETGTPSGGYEVFAHGFPGVAEFTAPKEARFRPGGLAVGPDGSLYVADTEKGRVWRIVYTGQGAAPTPKAKTAPAGKATAAPAPRPSGAPRAAAAAAMSPGAKVYAQACATCHMADGSGVPGRQPEIAGSKVVSGDPATFMRLMIHGPKDVLPKSREKFDNEMPSFGELTDEEIAAVVSYVRRRFGKAGPVNPAQVAAQRR